MTTPTPQPQARPRSNPIPDLWAQPLDAFAASLRLRDFSPQSIELRCYHLRRFAREIDHGPWDVSLDDVMTWMGSHSWRNETIRAVRSSLRVFYGWAVKTGRTEQSPAEHLPQIKPGGRNPKPVPEADFATSMSSASTASVRLMIRLAGELGLRRAEVAQLHINDIECGDDGFLLRVLGKGRKERHIPLSDQFAADIENHVIAHGTEGWAFPSPSGGHLSPHWVGSLVSQALPDGYTMHKLRHRAATQAHRRSGGDLLLTSNLLGHSSVATTQIYVAPDYSRLRAIVEGLGS